MLSERFFRRVDFIEQELIGIVTPAMYRELDVARLSANGRSELTQYGIDILRLALTRAPARDHDVGHRAPAWQAQSDNKATSVEIHDRPRRETDGHEGEDLSRNILSQTDATNRQRG